MTNSGGVGTGGSDGPATATPAAAARESACYTDVAGGQLHVRRHGSGSPIVLLHDAGSSSAGWVDLARRLATAPGGRTVLAPDLIGAGGSTVDDAIAGDLAAQADAVADAMRQLGVARAPVAGDGAGAAVALALADRHPDLVTAVAVLGTPAAADAGEAPDWPRPDPSGAALLAIWDEVRDGATFRPWWRRRADARMRRPLPGPGVLHQVFLDVAEHGGAHRRLADAARRGWTGLAARASDARPAGDDPAGIIGSLPEGAIDAARARESAGPRGYVDLDTGQIHLRRFGRESARRPLLLLHANPGSGAGLEALARQLGESRPTIVWDTPGHGRSADLPDGLVDGITLGGTYGQLLVAMLDRLGIDRCDVYGTHTGAGLAAEMAIAAPDRVGSLVLDGVPLFDDDPDLVTSVLQNYFTDLTPDSFGSHLRRAWGATADMALWWPHFNHTVGGIREVDGYSPELTHRVVLDMLRSAPHYHRYYRAAWTWPATTRLPLVAHRTLVGSPPADPLRAMTPTALALLPNAHEAVFAAFGGADSVAANAASIAAFLDEACAQ